MSHTDAGIGLCTFATPRFVWALLAGMIAVLSPVFDPSKTGPVPVCIPFCLPWLIHKWDRVSFDSTEVCFDLLHFLSFVLVGARSSMNLMVSVGVSLVVPSMSHIASFCTLSSFSRCVCAIAVRPGP